MGLPSKGPPVAPPRNWVILLVDDEEDILESTKALIEGNLGGVSVLLASSGRQALEVLERERIDLILSDFKMPGMDGIEFLFQARRRHPNVPRVMFTAFNDEELARRAIVEAMVSSFLSKTVAADQLLAQITALLRYDPARPPASGPVIRGPGEAAAAS